MVFSRVAVAAHTLLLLAATGSGQDFSYPDFSNMTGLTVSRNQSVLPGETWHFQAWFKDGASSNFTDGLSVLFQ
jgi:hypothetical protein